MTAGHAQYIPFSAGGEVRAEAFAHLSAEGIIFPSAGSINDQSIFWQFLEFNLAIWFFWRCFLSALNLNL